MLNRLGRYSEFGYTLLRFVSGAMFACHGAQKIFGLFGGMGGHGGKAPIGSLMGVGGLIELVGGILIAIGLFASVAAFIASGEMAVAYFMVHFKQGFWPIENKGEPAVLYCFIFLYIAMRGAGRWSLSRK